MKIYTKTGDSGETSLFGGKRLPKDALRVEAYGTVDELNSVIGVCRSMNTVKEVDSILEEIQNDLFVLGSDLAAPLKEKQIDLRRIQTADVDRIEHVINSIELHLEPIRHFILPGGNQTAANLHLARTVCRRAERLGVRLAREEEVGEVAVVYLNRLSDLLFVLARWVNALGSSHETPWPR